MSSTISAPASDRCAFPACGRTAAEHGRSVNGHAFVRPDQVRLTEPHDPFRAIRKMTDEERAAMRSGVEPVRVQPARLDVAKKREPARPAPAKKTQGVVILEADVKAVHELLTARPNATGTDIAEAILLSHVAPIDRAEIIAIARAGGALTSVSMAAIDGGLHTLRTRGDADKSGRSWRLLNVASDRRRYRDVSQTAAKQPPKSSSDAVQPTAPDRPNITPPPVAPQERAENLPSIGREYRAGIAPPIRTRAMIVDAVERALQTIKIGSHIRINDLRVRSEASIENDADVLSADVTVCLSLVFPTRQEEE